MIAFSFSLFTTSGGTNIEFASLSDPVDIEDEDEDYKTDHYSSRQERSIPEYRRRLHKRHKGNIQMNANEAFSMPTSEIRWKGFAMADARSRDGGLEHVRTKRKREEGGLRDAVTRLSVVFTMGGSMLVLMMGIIILFAIW